MAPDPAHPLDAAQEDVVRLPVEVSAAVIGGPGTGKTTALRARMLRIVDEAGGTDAALVLTPTRPGATALRDDLAVAVGRASAGPLARSIASFAFQVVRADAVRRKAPPPQLLTGGDEDQLLRDLLDGDAADEASGIRRWPQSLPASVRGTAGFRAEVRAFLAECAALGIPPAEVRRRGEDDGIPVWAALASFAEDYLEVRDRMRAAHLDAASLTREAASVLRDPASRVSLPAGLRAVLVDDAQELTLGAIELLDAIRAHGVAVVAFGDPDIGSGAFRGARPEYFATLAARLGRRIVLDEPHRGTPWMHDHLRGAISRIGAVGLVEHRRAPAGAEPDGSLLTAVVRSPAEEYDLIARILRERHLRDGVEWDRCAVIAHDTRQVAALETELAARDVPARAPGATRSLGSLRPVRDLVLTVLAALESPAGGDPVEVLSAAGFDPLDLRRLRTALRAGRAEDDTRPVAELLASGLSHPLEFALLDTREGRAAARVAETLGLLRDRHAAGATAHELLWTAWERSGRQRAWAQTAAGGGPSAAQADRDLDAVVALFQAAKRYGERQVDAEALPFLRGVLDSDVAEDRLEAEAPRRRVRVVTPAAAGGSEYDTVVVAGVQEGVWPNIRPRGSLLETWRLADAGTAPAASDRRRAALHDELRLFVRALSRARRRVVVTAVSDDDTGPSPFLELLPAPMAPRAEHPLSLRGLVAAHRRTLTSGTAARAHRAAAAEQLVLLSDARVPGADPSQWYGMLAPSSEAPAHDPHRAPVRVSPSRVGDIEQCQLNWIIGDLGGDPGGSAAGVGTLVHAAAELASGGADEEALWAHVDAHWAELEFESPWRARAEKTRARDIVRRLAHYLRDFERDGGRLLEAEPHFEVPLALDGGGEAVLSGYIDRVELTAAGTVVIVDVKTGRREPQTDRKVTDHPQLAAYQLAHAHAALPATVGRPAGGAKLLVLQPTASSAVYAAPAQAPFDEAASAAFLQRVRETVAVMTGTRFLAPFEEHCRDDHSHGVCRIHTIGAVSAS